tara:strand:+ start:83 stop:610 length:528 start_codon:yes stop_codon:yes gene_type:complete
MQPGKSKEKGNRFERKIAKELGEWYYNDKNALIRSPSSGALATIRNFTTPVAGDIYQIKYVTTEFPFCVELKHHKDFNIEHLLFPRKSSRLWKAWEQCKRDANAVHKIPLLIYKQNYGTQIAVIQIKEPEKYFKTYFLSGHVAQTNNFTIMPFKIFKKIQPEQFSKKPSGRGNGI